MRPDEIVETMLGKVRGSAFDGVFTFKGIPYGDSTAGKNRFLPPKKARAWAGVFDATHFGPRAPQQKEDLNKDLPWRRWIRSDQPVGEDCLVLNVFAPSSASRGGRPVLFYVHGGGFGDGSSCAPGVDGAFLSKRGDIVVVTINHRLNVLGHLYLGDNGPYADAGNNGILDIIAALVWVRENISAFGGDPDNVTISGHSGGGSKVAVLMNVPAARGLFRRAIIQSGSSMLRMATREEALRCSNALLAELNINRDRLDDLQSVPLKTLMEARKRAESVAGNHFRPVVDGRTLPFHPFSRKDDGGQMAGIPLLIGTCEDELRFHMGHDAANFSLSDAEVRKRTVHFLDISDAQAAELIAGWRCRYPLASPSDIMFSIFSEHQYRRNNISVAELMAAPGRAPVFMYLFTWKTKVMGGVLRAPHTMCLAFCFGTAGVAAGMLGTGADVEALKHRVMDAWIAFIKDGDPNHAGLPEWPNYSSDSRQTMIFDNNCFVINDPKSADRLLLGKCPEYIPVDCRSAGMGA